MRGWARAAMRSGAVVIIPVPVVIETVVIKIAARANDLCSLHRQLSLELIACHLLACEKHARLKTRLHSLAQSARA